MVQCNYLQLIGLSQIGKDLYLPHQELAVLQQLLLYLKKGCFQFLHLGALPGPSTYFLVPNSCGVGTRLPEYSTQIRLFQVG